MLNQKFGLTKTTIDSFVQAVKLLGKTKFEGLAISNMTTSEKSLYNSLITMNLKAHNVTDTQLQKLLSSFNMILNSNLPVMKDDVGILKVDEANLSEIIKAYTLSEVNSVDNYLNQFASFINEQTYSNKMIYKKLLQVYGALKADAVNNNNTTTTTTTTNSTDTTNNANNSDNSNTANTNTNNSNNTNNTNTTTNNNNTNTNNNNNNNSNNTTANESGNNNQGENADNKSKDIEIKGNTEETEVKVNKLNDKGNVLDFSKVNAKNILINISKDAVNNVLKEIELKLEGANIILPIKNFNQGENITFKAEKVELDDKQISDLAKHENEYNKITPLAVYRYEVYGDNKKIEKFNEPVTVSMNVYNTTNVDKNKTNVFFVSDNGDMIYSGGKWQGDTITFKAKHFSTYAVIENAKTFKDIASNWSKYNIEVLASKQITLGVNSTDFAPNSNVTRAQFASFIVRTLGADKEKYNNQFEDVRVLNGMQMKWQQLKSWES
jgi:hypothetical protein